MRRVNSFLLDEQKRALDNLYNSIFALSFFSVLKQKRNKRSAAADKNPDCYRDRFNAHATRLALLPAGKAGIFRSTRVNKFALILFKNFFKTPSL